MLMRRWILGLSACLLAAGCGDDTDFTKSEAITLAQVVWHVATAPSFTWVLDTESASYDIELTCIEGGKTQTSGTTKGDGSNHTVEGTTTLTDCAEYQPPCEAWGCDDDPVVTLNGDVHRETELAWIQSDGWTDFDVEGRLSGELTWETDDGESGFCDLDVEAVSEIDLFGDPVREIRTDRRMSGTVCGTPVDVEGIFIRFFGPPGVADRGGFGLLTPIS